MGLRLFGSSHVNASSAFAAPPSSPHASGTSSISSANNHFFLKRDVAHPAAPSTPVPGLHGNSNNGAAGEPAQPHAAVHVLGFDVLLVATSVVSTLLVVAIVLVILLTRLLRRVAAASAFDDISDSTVDVDTGEGSDEDLFLLDHRISSVSEEGQEDGGGRGVELREEHQPLLHGTPPASRRVGGTPASAHARHAQRARLWRSNRHPSGDSVMQALRLLLGMAPAPHTNGSHSGGDHQEEEASSMNRSERHRYARHRRQRRRRMFDAEVDGSSNGYGSGEHLSPSSSRRPPWQRTASYGGTAAAHGGGPPNSSIATVRGDDLSASSLRKLLAAAATHPEDAEEARLPAERQQDGGATAAASSTLEEGHNTATPAAAAAAGADVEPSFKATTQQDMVVFNTTHDSRYRLLQRIGMGAFSSVYLVQHKLTGKRYALKYILCKDDRERLAALRECEVIHCLQGHPQVIRIVDMFMNYQFQRGGGNSGAATAAAAAVSHSGRQSVPWHVSPAAAAQQNAAQSLVRSPSLWARPAATPTTPLLLAGDVHSHECSSISPSPLPQQQQQQQQQPGIPFPRSPVPTTATAAGGAARDGGASISSAAPSPASPSSPVAGAGAVATKWVAVQLQGLHDSAMRKVGSSAQLADDEVVAALRARIRGFRGDSSSDSDEHPEERQPQQPLQPCAAGRDGGTDGEADTDAEEEEEPQLLLSAADTERLLMDARLLQQRRHRQREQSRRQRTQHPQQQQQQQQVWAGAGQGGSGASRGRSLSASSQHQQHHQQLHLHQTSRSSSSTTHLTRPLEASGMTYSNGVAAAPAGGGASSLAGSSSLASTTRASVPAEASQPQQLQHYGARVYSPSSMNPAAYRPTYMSSGARRQEAEAPVHDPPLKGGTGGGGPGSCVTDGITTTTANGARSSRTITATTTTVNTARNTMSHSSTSRDVAHEEDDEDDEHEDEDVEVTRVGGFKGSVMQNTSKPTSIHASPVLQQPHHLSGPPPLQRRFDDSSSSASSSSGSGEEPLQPIRRILVAPPSFMHPPAKLDMHVEPIHKLVSTAGLPAGSRTNQEPGSPFSYAALNRYSNFTLGGSVSGPSSPTAPSPTSAREAESPTTILAWRHAEEADVDAPTPAAAAAAARAPPIRQTYAPRSRSAAGAGSITSYAPAQASSPTSASSSPSPMAAGNTVAPLGQQQQQQQRSQPSSPAPTVTAAAAAVVVRYKDFCYPASPASASPAPAVAAAASTSEQNKPVEDSTSQAAPSKGAHSPSPSAATATAEPDDLGPSNRAGGGTTTVVASSSHAFGLTRNTRTGAYVNPYLARAGGGEVVPPPRTSYAPGGGMRYSGLVLPHLSSAPMTDAATTTDSSRSASHRGPVTRPWNDGSSLPSHQQQQQQQQQQEQYDGSSSPPPGPEVECVEQPTAAALSSATTTPPAAAATAAVRNTYAPLRYGNLVQPPSEAVFPGTQLAQLYGGSHPSTPSPPPPEPTAAETTPTSFPQEPQQQKPTSPSVAAPVLSVYSPGRLSVSAAIRAARAGQQGERMHLNDGKPHVHVPSPAPEATLARLPQHPPTAPPAQQQQQQQPYRYPYELNCGSQPHDTSRTASHEEEEEEGNHARGYRAPVMRSQIERATHAVPSPHKPQYTNLGVLLAGPATPSPPPPQQQPSAAAPTATSHLFGAPAGSRSVVTYGTADHGSEGVQAGGYGRPRHTYAPAVRYANADNPSAWNGYGQTSVVAIGPASVAAARASAAAAGVQTRTNNTSSAAAGGGTLASGDRDRANGDGKEDEDSSATGTVTSTTQSNSSGSLLQDMRDTGYLCLVMEYHPMGDLCHYVLRAHQQLQKQQQLLQRSTSNFFDLRNGTEATTPSPSEQSSVLAPQAAGGGGAAATTADPSSPTALMNASTTSWLAAAAAATWRVKPATSRSASNLLLTGGGGNGSPAADVDDPTSRNPLTEPQLLSIAYQLSSVLDHMHRQNPPVIHRDLKPENILIKGELTDFLDDIPGDAVVGFNATMRSEHHHTTTNSSKPASPVTPAGGASVTSHSPLLNTAGAAAAAAAQTTSPPPIRITRAVVPIVVTDFGLAMVQESHGRAHSGRGGGTRPYIAPESWQGATCTASDVWSLGCVLYALATGRLTARTVRLMSEEAKMDGFASRMLNDILAKRYSLAFASFVVSLLVVDPTKRPTAAQAAQCFWVAESEVRFDPGSPFFSNVLDL